MLTTGAPPQYINTSQYIQQRPNTIYRIGCQLLRIANTNIYRDTSVLIPSLRKWELTYLPPWVAKEEREKVGFIANTAMRHRWGG